MASTSAADPDQSLETHLHDRITADGPQYIKAKDLTDAFPNRTAQALGQQLAALNNTSDRLTFEKWGGKENSTTWYITLAD